MAVGADAVAGDWEAALAAALLGADRAPGAGPAPLSEFAADAGGDPGGALLARLAASGLYHRAGAGLGPAALAPIPAPEPSGLPCPPAASARLALLLEGDHAARPRVQEWLELAEAAGMRVPPWLLPALEPLRRDWPGLVDRVAGRDLDWLGRACAGAAEDVEEPAAGAARGSAGAAPDWTEGGLPERRTAFAQARAADPDAARAALEALPFRREKADAREAFVRLFEAGLADGDEPFLEACLDDRATGVRHAAQRLLARLPRSRYAARMGERAAAAVAIEGRRRLLGGTRHDLVVTLPEESPELARDGVEPPTYDRGGGRRARLLEEVLARAPLHALGAHPPRLWLELALRSEWAGPLLDGFQAAVRRERDPAWVEALIAVLAEAQAGRLGEVKRTDAHLAQWSRALALLPAAAWEEAVLPILRARRIETGLAALDGGPHALSEGFTAALLDWFAVLTRGSAAIRADLVRTYAIGRITPRAAPSEAAAATAAAILARLPEDAEPALRIQVAALAETLSLRATMRREFAQA